MLEEKKLSHPNHYKTPAFMEKFIAAASYIFPMAGFAIIIISALMKKDMKPFLKYHIFQSIFIAILFYLVAYALQFVMNLVSYIPIIKNIVSMITYMLNTPILLGFSVITFVYFVFVLYLVIGVIKGSDSYVPWVSNIIKANLRGQI